MFFSGAGGNEVFVRNKGFKLFNNDMGDNEFCPSVRV